MSSQGLKQFLGWIKRPGSARIEHSFSGFCIIIFTLLSISATTTYSTRMHNIHWNASNPMFRIDRTDNIFDINGGNHPWEYDQVNIVCPVYKPGGTTSESVQEKYIIYSVSKQEYDSCRITQSNPRIIAVCNRPYKHMYFTITFRSFTPTPGGLEFRPGQNYYFISTSSKTDLHRRVGGSCSANNMKVSFKVAPMPTISTNSDDSDDNSINSAGGDRSLIHEHHIPPASLHPFPGHQSISSGGNSGNSNLDSTYYYPTSEIRQAAEQDLQSLSQERKRTDSSIFRRDSHQQNSGVRGGLNTRQQQKQSKAAPSIMQSSGASSSFAFSIGVKILLIPLLLCCTFLCCQ